MAARTDNKFDDIVSDSVKVTQSWFLVVLALYFGSTLLHFPEYAPRIRQLLVLSFLMQMGIWFVALMNSALGQWLESRNQDPSIATAMVAIRFVGKLLIWAIVALLMLDNMGVQVGSLVAGLGVGGIAVALAVQRVLGDLLASISIVMDKPFEVGDTIMVGDMVGMVENVGLKTTRLRATSGEQLIISNSDLLSTRIRNMKRMKERRVVLTFSVAYQTATEKVALIPGWVKDVVSIQESLRFERSHLQKLGDSAILFETIYWVNTPDMQVYMDMQQAVNLAVLSKLASEGVALAYPTQTVFMQK
jgi:small-conductance mechanosensitive channel